MSSGARGGVCGTGEGVERLGQALVELGQDKFELANRLLEDFGILVVFVVLDHGAQIVQCGSDLRFGDDPLDAQLAELDEARARRRSRAPSAC